MRRIAVCILLFSFIVAALVLARPYNTPIIDGTITGDGVDSPDLKNGVGWTLVLDRDDHLVLLFKNSYWIDELQKRFPDMLMSDTSGSVTT